MKKPGYMDFYFILKKKGQNKNSGNSMYPENVYLVQMLKQRNTEAFQTIYDMYYSHILVYCSGYVTNKNIAQEMTQDTFVKLWEKSDLLPDDTMFQPLLYHIARNNCLNYLKHLKVTEKYQKFQAYRKSEVDLNIYALADESAQLIISEELETKILKVIDTPATCLQKSIRIKSDGRKKI